MAKVEDVQPMDAAEFAVARMELGEDGRALPMSVFSRALGKSERQCWRYEYGEAEIDPSVAKLVRVFLEVGRVF